MGLRGCKHTWKMRPCQEWLPGTLDYVPYLYFRDVKMKSSMDKQKTRYIAKRRVSILGVCVCVCISEKKCFRGYSQNPCQSNRQECPLFRTKRISEQDDFWCAFKIFIWIWLSSKFLGENNMFRTWRGNVDNLFLDSVRKLHLIATLTTF